MAKRKLSIAFKPYSQNQAMLLPPSLDELIKRNLIKTQEQIRVSVIDHWLKFCNLRKAQIMADIAIPVQQKVIKPITPDDDDIKN